jgi:hypothetical protein
MFVVCVGFYFIKFVIYIHIDNVWAFIIYFVTKWAESTIWALGGIIVLFLWALKPEGGKLFLFVRLGIISKGDLGFS